MASNMDIITAIYCTQLKLDQCDEPEPDHQASRDSHASGKLSREFLSIYTDRILVFPFD
jgi:hypothetical protein